jgi:hypothetical protein
LLCGDENWLILGLKWVRFVGYLKYMVWWYPISIWNYYILQRMARNRKILQIKFLCNQHST